MIKIRRNIAKGFALVEILIALTILSIVLMSVYTGISSSIYVMSGARNHTTAMLAAKSLMNQWILDRMRGPDQDHAPLEEYPGFYYNRVTTRFEHPLLGPIPAKRTEITVLWKQQNAERKYSLVYVYPTR